MSEAIATNKEKIVESKKDAPRKHEYTEVAIDKLKPSRFNPNKRTLPARLGGLMGSIASNGMPVPIVITETFDVGDGHRRLACAKTLLWETIPAVVWPGKTAQEIWSILNAHQMGMTPAQWLEAVVCGLSIDQPEIPRDIANDIREMIRLLDPETVFLVVDKGRSPDIIPFAKRIGKGIGKSTDEDTVRIVLWLLEFRGSQKALAAITSGFVDLLAEAIADMRDFDFEPVLK